MAKTPRFDRGRDWRGRQRRSLLRRWRRRLGPLLLLALILLGWQGWNNAAVRSAIGLPIPPGESVALAFPLCSAPGYSANCAVDGDTFRIGQRRIRVEGIDAPELHGRCASESEAARLATLTLAAWLNRAPFTMLPVGTAGHDQYGREVQQVSRRRANGSLDDLGAHMIASGQARAYLGGARQGWC